MSSRNRVELNPHELVVCIVREASLTLSNFENATKISAKVCVTVTNERIMFAPLSDVTYHVANKGDRVLPTFALPLSSIRETRFIQPWFGPYKYEMLSPTPDGIEPQAMWTLTLSFTTGGVFDFHEKFSTSREAVRQAHMDNIPEPLPAYEP